MQISLTQFRYEVKKGNQTNHIYMFLYLFYVHCESRLRVFLSLYMQIVVLYVSAMWNEDNQLD
jgi:hypothetical protein